MKLHRPSPALVISCIALFVALGGVGYAAATGSIDGREIKNNSVASKDIKNSSIVSGDVKNSTLTGSDLRNDAVKGSDVDELSLGKVGSAGQADNAATATNAANASNAGNANTVGGQRVVPFLYRQDSTTDDTPLASVGGMTLEASCQGGDNNLRVYNQSGALAEITWANVDDNTNTTEGGVDEAVANTSFEDVAADPDEGSTGQAGFVNAVTGRPVRVLYTLNQSVGTFDCSMSGFVIG